MSQKKAIHFGAGNIGRGFVAEFLHKSGYEVVFVDVVDPLISQLQQTPSYTVTQIGTHEQLVFTVTNYRAINSKTNESDVVEEIRTAQLVTCAVGPNILKFIAPVIAKGIDGRKDDEVPVAVIACENMIGATDTLRGLIEERTSKDRLETMSKRARYANAAIDRIVPNQEPNAGLNVKIESYCEWVVEKSPFVDHAHPNIDGVKWVDHLEPYIERKLFTVNTGHAAAAYYGYNQGKTTIAEALATPSIRELVQTILQETAALLIKKHAIDHLEQANYVQKIIERISNPYLEDTVIRVGRAPIRKVGRKERFIGPAAQLAERGLKFDGLLGAVEVALKFQNVEGDDESFKLSQILEKDNAHVATEVLTGLEPSHPLFSKVRDVVEKVQAQK